MAVIGLSFVFMLCSIGAGGDAALSGTVVDLSGEPLADARVFLQTGPDQLLREETASSSGRFSFDHLAPGLVGIFAIADGYAFGGTSVPLAVGETRSDIEIPLSPRTSVAGHVVDFKGEPIESVRLSVLLIQGDARVGLPFAQLAARGFAQPTTDIQGRFTIDRIPEGAKLCIKASHPFYAQTTLQDIAAGQQDVELVLHRGKVIEGLVVSQEHDLPVVNAVVQVRNASPPHDTVTATTDLTGAFLVKLNPGVYSARVSGGEIQSPTWRKLVVTEDPGAQSLKLYVSGTSQLHGRVCDAVSGEPIQGAKLVLEVMGNTACVAHTGPQGEYRFVTAARDNIVRLLGAPGYLVPEREAFRLPVEEGQTAEVPDFWLRPAPAYRLQVLNASLEPAPGVVVRILRPHQFGWHVTGGDGRVALHLGGVPADGVVVGLAEHMTQPLGALFAVNPKDADDAKVQLLRLASVRGKLVDEKGRGTEGIFVGGGPPADKGSVPLLLWQTVSRTDGTFQWDGLVPSVRMRCVCNLDGEMTPISGDFSVSGGDTHDLGELAIRAEETGTSLYGRALNWRANTPANGTPVTQDTLKGKGVVVVYCEAHETAMVVDAVRQAQNVLPNVAFVVVGTGRFSGDSAGIPVFSGENPATATTYLLNPSGKVVAETFGLPSLRALQLLAAQAVEEGQG